MIGTAMVMERSGDDDQETEIWGTWEDLLLACAVMRHGTGKWDSVAMELQARSPAAGVLTPQSCRQRYSALDRRFGGGGGDGGDSPAAALWVEELRKLRVAELRREVEGYDVSIVSLQLKVKRLKEERERSMRLTESAAGEPDLREEEVRDDGSQEKIPVGDSDSLRSSKESNSSTDLKEGGERNPGDEGRNPAAAPGSDNGRVDPATGSYNGSSETITKGGAEAAVAVAPPRPLGDSGESMVESKDGSDVQSSVSLSRGRRRERRRKTVFVVGSDGREADVAFDRIPAESQPLVSFLEIIRSHHYGSVFERRLESQEGVRYRGLVRQHVDLEMVRAKLERGVGGAYSRMDLFRDLLLLCNNAILFYPKTSQEHISAVHLRDLVSKEMSRTLASPVADELKPPPPPPELKLDPDSKSSAPLVVCRKQSSISTKEPSLLGEANDEREENREDAEEDQSLVKKMTKQRSGTRGLRSNKSRGRSGIVIRDALANSSTDAPSMAENKPELSTPATPVISSAKKRGALLLNRINRRSSPPPSKGSRFETLKASTSGNGERGGEQKKGANRKDNALKKVAEQGVVVKRGRPRKRAASTAVAVPPAKRARGAAEKTAGAVSKPAPRKKRGRK